MWKAGHELCSIAGNPGAGRAFPAAHSCSHFPTDHPAPHSASTGEGRRAGERMIFWDFVKPFWDLTQPILSLSSIQSPRLGADPRPALCALPLRDYGLAPEKPAIFTLFLPCSSLLRETPDPINPLFRTALSCSSSKAQLLFPVLSHPPPPVREAPSPPHVRSQLMMGFCSYPSRARLDEDLQ